MNNWQLRLKYSETVVRNEMEGGSTEKHFIK